MFKWYLIQKLIKTTRMLTWLRMETPASLVVGLVAVLAPWAPWSTFEPLQNEMLFETPSSLTPCDLLLIRRVPAL